MQRFFLAGIGGFESPWVPHPQPQELSNQFPISLRKPFGGCLKIGAQHGPTPCLLLQGKQENSTKMGLPNFGEWSFRAPSTRSPISHAGETCRADRHPSLCRIPNHSCPRSNKRATFFPMAIRGFGCNGKGRLCSPSFGGVLNLDDLLPLTCSGLLDEKWQTSCGQWTFQKKLPKHD